MPQSYIVVGLAFGDEAKGSLTEYLTKKHHAHWNIRFNGGAQCAHNVVRRNGVHHTFQQFGSGTFEHASTFLSKDVIIHPLRILNEAEELQNKGIPSPLRNLFIDGRALVITPYHQELNQLKERTLGINRHGSTGLGIGETRAWDIHHPEMTVRAHDLGNFHLLEERLRFVAESLVVEARMWDDSASVDEAGFLQNVLNYYEAGKYLHVMPDDYFPAHIINDGNLVFEGAQGILLDEKYGMFPHNTWSNTTTHNALELLKDYTEPVTTIGVMRPYMTRHGAGPLPTESPELALHDPHASATEWTGAMRYGFLDEVLLRYAIMVNGGIDQIALTHLDQISLLPSKAATTYDYHGQLITSLEDLLTAEEFTNLQGKRTLTDKLLDCVPVMSHNQLIWQRDTYLNIPITIVSYGPTINDKKEQ